MAMLPILAHAQKENIASCGPVPTENQLRWQDMEMYAFIHYSLNTYTDQEWGFGNEDPKLFNPSRHHLYCQAPLRFLYVALGLYGIFGEEFTVEKW